MKKPVCALLVLALVLGLAGCSLFSDTTIVNFDDGYTHHDPEDLKYDERIALKGAGFGEALETYVNSMAAPDTMIYDADGSILGATIFPICFKMSRCLAARCARTSPTALIAM